MASFVNEHGALEGHHFDAILIQPPSGNRYDPLRGSALRLALMQDRALSVDGIAGEDRMGRLHLDPTQVGDHFMLTVRTLIPVSNESVKVESTRGVFHSVLAASGCVEVEFLRIHCE